jgi:hypothetical protein
MVDSTVYFDLPSDERNAKVTEVDLKSVAAALQERLRRRGLPVDYSFGSSDDLWGFSFDFGKYEMLFSVSPNRLSRPQRWYADIELYDLGWFKSTREVRLAEFKRVERAVHAALVSDLHARNVRWYIGKGHVDRREARPEPGEVAKAPFRLGPVIFLRAVGGVRPFR